MKALRVAIGAALLATLGGPPSAQAGELDHYFPGLPNLRDYFLPDPGVYFLDYNAFYLVDRINDADGHEIRSVTLQNPINGNSITRQVDVDVDIYALAPTFAFVYDWKPFGLKVGSYISPSFSNLSVNATLGNADVGRNIEVSSFGVGDLFVQPVWLGHAWPHFELAFGYGFYAPIGRYDTETFTIPVIDRDVTVESPDNIGLGFWEHQLQTALAIYPWTSKGTAITGALTWEINQEKEDFDFTPGQHLTINYGVSQYLPLITQDKNPVLLLEVGPSGYSQWQVTDDHGQGSNNTRDQVHGIGFQLGLTYVPWTAAFNVKYIAEYASQDRSQGQVVSLTLVLKPF